MTVYGRTGHLSNDFSAQAAIFDVLNDNWVTSKQTSASEIAPRLGPAGRVRTGR
jgi:hypothetical protein